MDLKDSTFFLVGNIPESFRSSDLRAYFSHFIEKEFFSCFHYKHRPEELRQENSERPQADKASLTTSERSTVVVTTKCCVLALKSINTDASFMKMYQEANWSRLSGKLVPAKVRLNKLYVDVNSEGGIDIDKNIAANNTPFIPWADLASLPELNPPSVMPQGNVGTSLTTFMTLIRECKLPVRVIKKLHLEFPKSRSSRRYGAVMFKYEGHNTTSGSGGGGGDGDGDGDAPMKTSKDYFDSDCGGGGGGGGGGGDGGGGNVPQKTNKDHFGSGGGSSVGGHSDEKMKRGSTGDSGGNKGMKTGGGSDNRDLSEEEEEEEEDEILPDDDHDAEEWERYEAFHDDVDKQGRSKERLFEEDLEVVWEKGGSGLVFYTDASHWDQQDGDFDEKCSQEDDWDVDMSVYYDHAGGGRDARDMRNMDLESRLRDGKSTASWKEMGGFEKHTKGIGSKLLKRSGWTAGRGVGVTNQGIIEPVESDGQLPYIKRGFGYRGEKLSSNSVSSSKRRKMKDVIISTVYDKPEEEETTILRTAPPTVLKHRNIQFLEGGILHQSKK